MQDHDFFERVYWVVRQVPHGRVTSYGAIARYLSMPKASRMVGWAMNGSHSCQDPVPAHRVVNRVGMLTGKMHFEDPGKMQELLEEEGVKVLDDKVQDFDKLFWDPSAELE